MRNFKFNFLSQGQLESLNFDRFYGNLIFAIIARILCGNHLNQNSVLSSSDRLVSQYGKRRPLMLGGTVLLW